MANNWDFDQVATEPSMPAVTSRVSLPVAADKPDSCACVVAFKLHVKFMADRLS